MRLTIRLVVAALGAASLVGSAQAGNRWNDFWGGVHTDYQRNKCWPEPFVYYDREAAAAPFGPMVRKGWEHQNLVSEHHFEPDGKTLTQSGQLKVRWILTQAPIQYRQVFIERGPTADVTAVRLATVQRAATSLLPVGDQPQIAISNLYDPGHPAEYIDSVGRKFQASTPDPRLPKAASAEAAQ